jgi:hypothetical protein
VSQKEEEEEQQPNNKNTDPDPYPISNSATLRPLGILKNNLFCYLRRNKVIKREHIRKLVPVRLLWFFTE